MADVDQLMLQELAARVAALESGGSKDGGDESAIRQRLQALREEKVSKVAEGRYVANQNSHNGPRPTGQHRRDEMAWRTSNTLPSPENTRRSHGGTQDTPQTTGTPLDFYVWKDGQIAIVKVLCDGEPTLVT